MLRLSPCAKEEDCGFVVAPLSACVRPHCCLQAHPRPREAAAGNLQGAASVPALPKAVFACKTKGAMTKHWRRGSRGHQDRSHHPWTPRPRARCAWSPWYGSRDRLQRSRLSVSRRNRSRRSVGTCSAQVQGRHSRPSAADVGKAASGRWHSKRGSRRMCRAPSVEAWVRASSLLVECSIDGPSQ